MLKKIHAMHGRLKVLVYPLCCPVRYKAVCMRYEFEAEGSTEILALKNCLTKLEEFLGQYKGAIDDIESWADRDILAVWHFAEPIEKRLPPTMNVRTLSRIHSSWQSLGRFLQEKTSTGHAFADLYEEIGGEG